MKYTLTAVLLIIAVQLSAQNKADYVQYNRLIEMKGTDYVVATVEHLAKMQSSNSRHLLFINTTTGQSNQIDLPIGTYIERIEQLKLDTLGINQLLLIAQTVNLDGNKTIDWNDPKQVFIISPGGENKTQLTNDKFFAATWVVNRNSGCIVITGHYDSNNNGKKDKTDKNEIVIYDLKAMKMVNKI